MERMWYYAVGGVRQGPVTLEEVRERLAAGALGPEDRVWEPSFGPQWRRVSEVPELAGPPPVGAGPAVPPPVPPPVLAELAEDVPLTGVAGEPPECLAAAVQAFARMRALLFGPVRAARWYGMGFCAWLAFLGIRAGRVLSLADAAQSLKSPQFRESWEALSKEPAGAGVVAVFVLLTLGLTVWMCALRSRGDFMFLHRWYQPDAPVLLSWRAAQAPGAALFVWRLGFMLVVGLLALADAAAAYLLVVRPYLGGGRVWAAGLTAPAAACATFALLLTLAACAVSHLTQAFVVPVMYWRGGSAGQAWRAVLALVNRYPFAVLGYLAVVAGAALAAEALVVALVVCTCCLGAIPLSLPYVHAVVLLPVYLFLRGYGVCFISRWRPELVPAPKGEGCA